MKEMLAKAIIVKNIIIWVIISVCATIGLGAFVMECIKSSSSGKNIFWPGIAVLGLAILAVLYFAVTRVIKNVKLIKQIQS